MKAPQFAYARPESLEVVFDLLDRHGDDARILAGGQSLMATLNLRLSEPQLLIDINRAEGLAGITETGSSVRIGALTRHCDVETSPVVSRHLPLIAAAMPHIAHPAIRNRGTFGGSIALADPAAELPACSVALGASIVLRSRDGDREVPAADFFKGLFDTDLAPGELVVAAEFPKPGPGDRSAFAELARRRGDYAMVGLAAHGTIADGEFHDARLVFFGVGDRPVLAREAGRALDGQPVGKAAISAARDALAADLAPDADLNGGPEVKIHLARVLTGRVLERLAGSAQAGGGR